MPRRPIAPVSVAGIEFPAMLDETQTYTSSIPDYPVETGFTVSDSIGAAADAPSQRHSPDLARPGPIHG